MNIFKKKLAPTAVEQMESFYNAQIDIDLMSVEQFMEHLQAQKLVRDSIHEQLIRQEISVEDVRQVDLIASIRYSKKTDEMDDAQHLLFITKQYIEPYKLTLSDSM